MPGQIQVDDKRTSLARLKVLTIHMDPERFDPVAVSQVKEDGTFEVQASPGVVTVRVIG
jgi:hypothetical protein